MKIGKCSLVAPAYPLHREIKVPPRAQYLSWLWPGKDGSGKSGFKYVAAKMLDATSEQNFTDIIRSLGAEFLSKKVKKL